MPSFPVFSSFSDYSDDSGLAILITVVALASALTCLAVALRHAIKGHWPRGLWSALTALLGAGIALTIVALEVIEPSGDSGEMPAEFGAGICMTLAGMLGTVLAQGCTLWRRARQRHAQAAPDLH